MAESFNSDHKARFYAAQSLALQDEWQEARNIFDRLLADCGPHSAILISLGCVCRQMLDYDTALKYFDKAISLDSLDIEALAQKAHILLIQQKREEASSLYHQVISTQPDHKETKFALYMIGEMDGALTASESKCQQALDLQPDCASAHLSLGLINEKKGQIDQAIKLYTRASACDEESVSINLRLGILHYKRKRNYPQAKKFFDLAKQLGEESDSLMFYMGLNSFSQSQYNDAITAWESLCLRHPEDKQLKHNLQWALFKKARLEMEQEKLETAIQSWIKYLERFNQDFGRSLLAQKYLAKCLLKADSTQIGPIFYPVTLAIIKAEQDDQESAISELLRPELNRSADRAGLTTLVQIAGYYASMPARRGDWDTSVHLFEKILEFVNCWFPELDSELRSLLTRSLKILHYQSCLQIIGYSLEENDFEIAIKKLNELYGKYPDDFLLLHAQAVINYLIAVNEESKLPADRVGAYWRKGINCWAKLCRADDYWHYLQERTDRLDPKVIKQLRQRLPEILFKINHAYLKKYIAGGNLESARRHFSYIRESGFSAESIDGYYDRIVDPYLEKADQLESAGQYEEALKILEKWGQIDSENKKAKKKFQDLCFRIAREAEESGNHDKKDEYLKKIEVYGQHSDDRFAEGSRTSFDVENPYSRNAFQILQLPPWATRDEISQKAADMEAKIHIGNISNMSKAQVVRAKSRLLRPECRIEEELFCYSLKVRTPKALQEILKPWSRVPFESDEDEQDLTLAKRIEIAGERFDTLNGGEYGRQFLGVFSFPLMDPTK